MALIQPLAGAYQIALTYLKFKYKMEESEIINNKPRRLTVSYSRKFNLGNYESQDICVFSSWDAETDNSLEEQKNEIAKLKQLVLESK